MQFFSIKVFTNFEDAKRFIEEYNKPIVIKVIEFTYLIHVNQNVSFKGKNQNINIHIFLVLF